MDGKVGISVLPKSKEPPQKSKRCMGKEYYRGPVVHHTKSCYIGHWNTLDMSGKGNYVFKDGVIFNGTMREGMFEGLGTYYFPNKATLTGFWVNGTMLNPKFTFRDGLKFNPINWDYCVFPDRRFYTERINGFQAMTQLADDHPAREIPKDCYDTAEGFYSPRTKYLYHPLTGEIIRIVKPSTEKWIMKYCRKAWDENVTLEPTNKLYMDELGQTHVWGYDWEPDNKIDLFREYLKRNIWQPHRRSKSVTNFSVCNPLPPAEKVDFVTNAISVIFEKAGNDDKLEDGTGPWLSSKDTLSVDDSLTQCGVLSPIESDKSLKALLSEIFDKKRKTLQPIKVAP